ncbi:MAG: OsmC family protein [Planctomycetes bacterium]|nr:OsmC family protein [Planctomycetota bacterium]
MSMTYRVSAAVAPGGAASIEAQQGHIAFDGSAASGEALPGPAHLLAAALAACMLKNVERMSGMLKFAYTGATVEVEAEREEPPPRIVRLRYTLKVACEESPARLGLLQRNILKFGTITNTLSACCELTGQLIGLRKDGSQASADA